MSIKHSAAAAMIAAAMASTGLTWGTTAYAQPTCDQQNPNCQPAPGPGQNGGQQSQAPQSPQTQAPRSSQAPAPQTPSPAPGAPQSSAPAAPQSPAPQQQNPAPQNQGSPSPQPGAPQTAPRQNDPQNPQPNSPTEPRNQAPSEPHTPAGAHARGDDQVGGPRDTPRGFSTPDNGAPPPPAQGKPGFNDGPAPGAAPPNWDGPPPAGGWDGPAPAGGWNKSWQGPTRDIQAAQRDFAPFNYNNYTAIPVFSASFGGWGFWYFGVWVPLF